MDRCSLRFDLRPRLTSYPAGSRIQGELVVVCHEETAFRGLRLTLTWKTSGAGNSMDGDGVSRDLPSGTWTRGREYRYPVDWIVPPGPPTSSGSHIAVEWSLHAVAHYALLGKLEATLPIRVEPGPTWDPALHGPHYAEPEKELQAEATGVGCGATVAFVLLGFGGWAVYSNRYSASCGQWILGPLLLVLGSILLFAVLKRGVAAKKLGHPEVHVSSPRAAPGESVTVTVRLVPRAAVKLGPVTLQLRGELSAIRGSGKSSSTTRERWSDQPRVELTSGCRLAKGELLDLEGAVRIPSTARATLAVTDNKIHWWIEVRAVLLGWPDWERKYPLTVVPPPNPSSASPAAP